MRWKYFTSKTVLQVVVFYMCTQKWPPRWSKKWNFLLKRNAELSFSRFGKWKIESSIDFIRFMRGQDSGARADGEKLNLALRFQRKFHFLDHLGGQFCVHTCVKKTTTCETVLEVKNLAPLENINIWSLLVKNLMVFGLQDGPKRVISSASPPHPIPPPQPRSNRAGERRGVECSKSSIFL